MDTNVQPQGLRSLSLGSIALGLLGGAFYWWVPFGMVLSLAGLLLGLVDWVSARRRSLDFRLSIVGLVVSAIALVLTIAIAAQGLQTITFGGPP